MPWTISVIQSNYVFLDANIKKVDVMIQSSGEKRMQIFNNSTFKKDRNNVLRNADSYITVRVKELV